MTSILPYITARVMSAQVPRGFSGKGVVEKAGADGMYVIALSTGKLSAQCAPGSLSEGDVVLVKVSAGGDAIIEKTSVQSSLPTPLTQDALELKGQRIDASTLTAKDSARNPAASQRPGAGSALTATLSGPRLPAEGFYYFDTLDKALSWLSKVSPGRMDEAIRMIPDEYARSPVVIQVEATESEGMRAFLLSLDAAEARLAYFVRERLHSGMWDDFFPAGLLPLLRERGYLSSDRCVAFDALLPDLREADQSIPAPIADPMSGMFRSMGKSGVRDLFNQWLSVVLDESSPLSVLARQSPLSSAAGLPPLMEEIRRTQPEAQPGLSISPRIGDFSLDASTFDAPSARAEIVPRILERLGIDHERAILDSAESGTEPAGGPNLKRFLLTLDRDLEQITINGNSDAAGSPSRSASALCRSISEAWTAGCGQLLRELSFTEASQPFPSFDVDRAPGTEDEAALILRNFHAWSEKIESLMKTIISDVSSSAETLRSAVAHTRSAQQSSPETSRPDTNYAADTQTEKIDALVDAAVTRIKAAFGEIAGKIETALQSASAQNADILKARQVSVSAAVATSVRTPAFPSPPDARLRAQASGAMHEITLQALRQVRLLSGLVDRVVSQSSKMVEDMSRDNAVSGNTAAAETTRRLVETALHQIESLQISAKPTIAGDVRQQVVMVPMNIDGQWNDVIVKFVRDDNQGKKKGPQKNVKVSISVAPAFLGDISVAMDYKGKDLSVRMDFDKDRTLSWFETNRQGLVDAFVKLGFKNPHMTMQKNALPSQTVAMGGARASNAAIDIMV